MFVRLDLEFELVCTHVGAGFASCIHSCSTNLLLLFVSLNNSSNMMIFDT